MKLTTMFIFLASVFIMSCSTSKKVATNISKRTIASSDCDKPAPTFGKVVATCGNQMITFIGSQPIDILGVSSKVARFELSYCSNGGVRKGIDLKTNANGYKFTYFDQHSSPPEKYEITNMWGKFNMEGIDNEGEEVKASCQAYNDTSANIEYIYK